ncbi:hypothetical protein [Mycobacterium sp. 1245801.1]|uniref:hypothetical protein n=1 Tax=Mycobacterium sp. 1245801.1 TaxID=1834075 RepID=UPI000A7338B4|nr:hypothetical protein [Mycobacterium sp. 1245801.1]
MNRGVSGKAKFELRQILIAEQEIWDAVTAWARFKRMPLKKVETAADDDIPTYRSATDN